MNKQGKTIMASVQVVYYRSSHGYWVEVHPEDPKQQYRAGPFNLDDASNEAQKLNTLLLHRDLANALEAVNRVLHWGCNERQPPYLETGWKDVPLDKYKQALLRHQSEWLKDPSSLDAESGKLHLAHMATNALILLQRWPEEGKDGSTDH